MENWQIFLIAFGIFNLCLFVFRRALSSLVLGFFAIGRKICPPDIAEIRAAKMGFQGLFSDPELTNPSRKRAIQFLAWTGGINFLGCIGFYVLIASGVFSETSAEQGVAPNRSTAALLNSESSVRGSED